MSGYAENDAADLFNRLPGVWTVDEAEEAVDIIAHWLREKGFSQ